MLFSRGGCTQEFNTFLAALKGGVLNPFGTNKIMNININGEERTYNDTYNKWTKKWYPYMKIWYCIF